MTRIARGMFTIVLSMRKDLEAKLQMSLDKLLEQMNLVRREEFEAVKEIAVQARLIQEDLLKRLETLETFMEQNHKEKQHHHNHD